MDEPTEERMDTTVQLPDEDTKSNLGKKFGADAKPKKGALKKKPANNMRTPAPEKTQPLITEPDSAPDNT